MGQRAEIVPLDHAALQEVASAPREYERCWMSPSGEPDAAPVPPTFPSPDR